MAIGANGLVWVKATDVRATIVIRNAIINAASGLLNDVEIEIMVDRLVAMSSARQHAAEHEND